MGKKNVDAVITDFKVGRDKLQFENLGVPTTSRRSESSARVAVQLIYFGAPGYPSTG